MNVNEPAKGVVMRYFLVLTALSFCGVTVADETLPKWDDKFFGFAVKLPTRGRFWVVSDVVAESSADVLREGDEIMEVDGNRISLDTDLTKLLQKADDKIKIKAKRYIGKKRVIGEATFERITRWDWIKQGFTEDKDSVSGLTLLTPDWPAENNRVTHFLPSIIMKGHEPMGILVRFQYRAESWLFIRNITIKYGEQTLRIDREGLGEVKRDVLFGEGIKEWFTLTGDEAEKILSLVGEPAESVNVVRMNGKDYYKDREFSKIEQIAFRVTKVLWEMARERHEDLVKAGM